MEVKVAHDSEKKQARILSQVFASFMEDTHQPNKNQDEVDSNFVKKEMTFFRPPEIDQKS